MGHLKKLKAFSIALLIILSVLPRAVLGNLSSSQYLVEPLKNWSFEQRGSSVYSVLSWSSNNGGWRELCGDCYPQSGDGTVDIFDLTSITNAWGSRSGDPNWNPNADLNGDNIVDIYDLIIVANDFGKNANRKDGFYSWFTSEGGNYTMVQWLDADTVEAIKGMEVAFSFWFYPESVAPDGSQNKAQAGIYYEYAEENNTAYGDLVSPTEIEWYNAFVKVSIPETATAVEVIVHGVPNFKAYVDLADLRITTVYAYSDSYRFDVPNDGNVSVSYHHEVEIYVWDYWHLRDFWFKTMQLDEWVLNVKIDGTLKYSGSTGNPPGQPVSVDLGALHMGYHMLEFDYVEQFGLGVLNFTVALDGNPATGKAGLTRFHIEVPDYSDTEYKYTVKTYTYFPGDTFFLGGYADDYIDDVMVDVGLIWQDWMWDMGPTYGAIYGWGDGFMYPLDWQYGWHPITFTFGEISEAGLLDFQYISWTNQQERIGNPKFWTRASIIGFSPALEINEAEAWTGSKWISEPGRSMRQVSTTLRVLANTTHWKFYPISQEAQVSLILDWLDPLWNTGVPQEDIGIKINLTYTYYDENSIFYGMPIKFHPYNIEVRLAEQGNALYMPTQGALVFNDVSERSFITPEWKVIGTASGMLMNFFITPTLYYEFGPAGAIVGVSMAAMASQLYNFFDTQQLSLVQENLGNETYRKFIMNEFKTAYPFTQEPITGSVCEGFFIRIVPSAPTHCGMISINLKGYLYLPFFTIEWDPVYGYGTWFPIDVELEITFPVFVID
jgi:hypothetical protein